MKQFYLAFVFTFVSIFVYSQNFYLAPNGVTCMCPDAAIGETGVVNGITYTKRTKEQITPGNAATTCTSGITDMSNLFQFNSTFNENISNWDVSNVTNMSFMFYNATSFDQPLDYWDVSNVTVMIEMFRIANSFNQPLNDWDVSSVTDMSSMFASTGSFNQPLNDWDVSSVTEMRSMFSSADSFNQPLNDWDVSNVITMAYMFSHAYSFNQPLNDWDVSSVNDMQWMFLSASSFNQPLNDWNVSNVTSMSYMFSSAVSFNQPLNGWNVSSITDMSFMFNIASSFNQPINGWDVSNVTDMYFMFNRAIAFNQTLNDWDVSSVSNMSYMFNRATSFNQPLNAWNVSNVTEMRYMFSHVEQSSFNQPLNDWDVSSVTNMNHMFYRATSFNQSLNNWDVSSVIDMSYMFSEAYSFNQLLNEWDVSSVIDMRSMFHLATSFNQPINDWDVSSVTNMNFMFFSANSFNQTLIDWDVSSVTEMRSMFSSADYFNQPLNNWDVSNVTDMSNMFYNASAFNKPISDWNVSSVTNMRWMYRNAISFNQALNNWNVSSVTDMSYMFHGATSFDQDLSFMQINTNNLDGFISYSGLSNNNYSNFLSHLASLELEDGDLGAYELTHCNQAARDYLVIEMGWYIYGDSLANDCNKVVGTIFYDQNNNGCDIDDIVVDGIMINANDGINDWITFSRNGNYDLGVIGTNFTVSVVNYPTYFTVTPESATVIFSGSNVEELDFCLTANQTVNDLNITLLAIEEARPGFETDYQVVVRNVGTETLNNVSATLNFDNVMQSFVSALPIPSSTTSSSLSFELGTLQPFETRYMDITMQTFPPPTVNGDDILQFTAMVTPDTGDYTPDDNTYQMEQVVVNSFDPNDKQVMQGAEVHIDDVDQYLDYLIRFQNTGTASAINVRILDTLHPKLDWNTLIPISASHDYVVQITDGNEVEFLFDDINLPHEAANEPESHGFVAYKIKPKSDVQVGDIISGDAAIYFDFNAPIITDMVFTEIVDFMNITDINESANRIVVHPNPTNKLLHIQVTEGIQIEESTIYDLQGKSVQKIPGNERVIDVEKLSPGMYFLKITTNKETITRRFVKK